MTELLNYLQSYCHTTVLCRLHLLTAADLPVPHAIKLSASDSPQVHRSSTACQSLSRI